MAHAFIPNVVGRLPSSSPPSFVLLQLYEKLLTRLEILTFTFPDSPLCWLRAPHHTTYDMADNYRTNYGPQIAAGVFEVRCHRIGKAIIDSLRKNFTGDGQMQRGDFYMNRSRELLQRHLKIIRLDDKNIIQEKYAEWVRRVQVWAFLPKPVKTVRGI